MLESRPKVKTDINSDQQVCVIYKRTKMWYVPFYIMYRQSAERFKHLDKDEIIRYLLYFKSDIRLPELAHSLYIDS